MINPECSGFVFPWWVPLLTAALLYGGRWLGRWEERQRRAGRV
jgi:hypothetical protein